MTVSSDLNKQVYVGNGATKSWTFSFQLRSANDLKLYVTDTVLNTTTQITSLYTITPTGGTYPCLGGNVLYPNDTTAALSSTKKLTLIREMNYTQDTLYPNNTALRPKVVEDSLDKAVMLIQQLKEKVDRSVKLDITQTTEVTDITALTTTITTKTNEAAASAAAAAVSATSAATSAASAASAGATAGSTAAQSYLADTTAAKETAVSSATAAANSATSASNSATASSSSANLAAAYALSATGRLVICTISGTFTVPDEVTTLYLLACAGGGGGGSYFGPGGGGGESCFWLPYTVTPGQVITYTIGAGGLGSTTILSDSQTTTGNFSGTNGGNTVFGTLTLVGGYRGFCDGTTEYPGSPGGLGGTQGGGMSAHIDMRNTSHFGANYYNGGKGGDCAGLGVGGSGGFWNVFSDATKTSGGNGQGYGAGGGGGAIKTNNPSGTLSTSCTSGGNGASGIIIIRF